MFKFFVAVIAILFVSTVLKFGQWLRRDIDFNDYDDTE